MIEDPSCLLTASRDRSVKLRAIPTRNDHYPNDRSATNAHFNGHSATKDHLKSPRTMTADTLETKPIPPSSIPGCEPVRQPGRDSERKDAEGNVKEKMIPEPLAALQKSTSVLQGADGGGVVSERGRSCVVSASRHRYGHDLSILTLGRIADGLRRDRYDFPMDLEGRGEGRAVEARAVMQVQSTCCVVFSGCF